MVESLPSKNERLIAGKWLQVRNIRGIPDSVELNLTSVNITGNRDQMLDVWCPMTGATRSIAIHTVECVLGSIQFPMPNRHSHLRVQPDTQRPSL